MLVDTHAHLMDTAFANDLPAVLERAAAAGVVAMVCVGYDEQSSVAAVALAERYPQIVAAVGIHPNSSGAARPGAFERIDELAQHPRVVGIGETGLDNYRKRTPPAVQREWFQQHLDLAARLDLPGDRAQPRGGRRGRPDPARMVARDRRAGRAALLLGRRRDARGPAWTPASPSRSRGR